ncbi:ribonuclease HII-domain-containing protein [Lipomyces oligophaga]|uniref:ribonuclease HII-domain-containing protein n=1 Tax=Lipomyces oligophaga TaxID=45792 RepID=UPI0034CE07D2
MSQTTRESGFVPLSVSSIEDENISCTYHSPIPKNIAESPADPCILGVDEAGRGPVLGAMVYALSYCPKQYESTLSNSGFADSKTLTHQVRMNLFEQLCRESDQDDSLFANVGYATRIMSARDISKGMLQSHHSGSYNLNEQAHDTTIALISDVYRAGIKIEEIYVDTVGPPESYQAKLSKHFPQAKIRVTKKADSLFPIVSAASVCAKVTRDLALLRRSEAGSASSPGTEYGEMADWGSGYPGDARTVTWLKENLDPVFGWSPVVRFSWGTAKDLLDKNDNFVKVDWPDANGKLDFTAQIKKEYWFGNPATI